MAGRPLQQCPPARWREDSEPDGQGAGQAQGLSLDLCFGERAMRPARHAGNGYRVGTRVVAMANDLHSERARPPCGRGASVGMRSPCRSARKNTVIPSTGDERCWPVVPPLFAGTSRSAALAARRDGIDGRCGERRIARCIGPVTGAVCPSPGTRRRLLHGLSVVRGAARGSCSLAFRIPLRSNRGSLHPPCQVLVPVVASTTSVVVADLTGSETRCQAPLRYAGPIRRECSHDDPARR